MILSSLFVVRKLGSGKALISPQSYVSFVHAGVGIPHIRPRSHTHGPRSNRERTERKKGVMVRRFQVRSFDPACLVHCFKSWLKFPLQERDEGHSFVVRRKNCVLFRLVLWNSFVQGKNNPVGRRCINWASPLWIPIRMQCPVTRERCTGAALQFDGTKKPHNEPYEPRK